MYANLLLKGALTWFLIAMVEAPEAEKFVPHKNAPGPPRLNVEKADNSGVVNTDVQFIADRLTIINHISASAYLMDEGRWDD
ncbi:hypothetical protein JQ597_26640 [Bradyrhizobium sp. AUGA SZCCT0177]|uniref:hypothetical protein n=1 Tax=unclassified Bradyrhizobium TaxID=2631580 RepID=UPI001BA7048A|nr:MULTISPECIES: hypothetical protein [unclassified Bradyrhizobium]MBR1236401.1 hypothetical protein [Bradyrhizobium sp. AUGA SZCCT0182]MBR1285634.1 hypothetical protein [Bradyrhizobium sp. AUGA SZCCT0177]